MTGRRRNSLNQWPMSYIFDCLLENWSFFLCQKIITPHSLVGQKKRFSLLSDNQTGECCYSFSLPYFWNFKAHCRSFSDDLLQSPVWVKLTWIISLIVKLWSLRPPSCYIWWDGSKKLFLIYMLWPLSFCSTSSSASAKVSLVSLMFNNLHYCSGPSCPLFLSPW